MESLHLRITSYVANFASLSEQLRLFEVIWKLGCPQRVFQPLKTIACLPHDEMQNLAGTERCSDVALNTSRGVSVVALCKSVESEF